MDGSDAQQALAKFADLADHLGSEASQLWGDAFALWKAARARRLRPDRRARFWRAAVVMASAGFEGWTNYLAEKVMSTQRVSASRPSEFELDCLHERQKRLRDGGVVEEEGRFSSKNQFLLLYRLLNGGQSLDPGIGRRLESSLKLRDRLVHPKPGQPIDALELERAYNGFLEADVALATAWVRANSERALRPYLVKA